MFCVVLIRPIIDTVDFEKFSRFAGSRLLSGHPDFGIRQMSRAGSEEGKVRGIRDCSAESNETDGVIWRLVDVRVGR